MHAYIAPVVNRDKTPLMLRQVPIPYLKDIGPHVIGMLESVVERSNGRWTLDDMAARFYAGEWQMWIVYDGEYRAVLATEVFTEPSEQKAARVVFVTGLGAAGWTKLVEQIEEWARNQGCVRMEMIARKGWAKHLDEYARNRGVAPYKMTHVLLEKAL